MIRQRLQRQRRGEQAQAREKQRSLNHIANAVAKFTGGALPGGAGYDATDSTQNYLEGLRPVWGSSDSVLVASLGRMIAQGRHVMRNVPLAKAVSWAYRADVIGSGINIEPSEESSRINEVLRRGFRDWADHAGVNGESLWDLQWTAAGELVAAGAPMWRVIIDPDLAENGQPPVRIQPLEVEWLSEHPAGKIPKSHRFVLGVEYDAKGRKVAYHISDPDTRGGVNDDITVERVPDLAFGDGQGIVHAFPQQRANQTHGEPIIAPVIERFLQANDLIRNELNASRVCSNLTVGITSDPSSIPFGDEDETDDPNGTGGTPVQSVPLGSMFRFLPGEDVKVIKNDRPTQNINNFLNIILGDISGATGVSQRWLNRNMDGSNYSRDRMDQLLTKRVMERIKRCLGHHFAGRIYEAVAPWILLASGNARPEGGFAYELRPDQPEYIDPDKDAKAILHQLDGGLITYGEALAMRGKDMDTVIEKRVEERRRLRAAGLPVPGLLMSELDNPSVAQPDPLPSQKNGGGQQGDGDE